MLRPFRPAFENLEKREVFSTGLLIGLGNVGISAPPTEPVAYSFGATQTGSFLRGLRSGQGLPSDQNAAAPAKPVAINWGDGQADLALMGDGSVRLQTQFMHEEEDADDVNHITAESHDAVFAQMGRTGGGFLGLEREHPSILIGYLLP